MTALAYWATAPGRGDLRPAVLPASGPDDCLVTTLVSGISAGTERLVAQGRVPDAVADVMRAPLQEGDFPFPVKYGYLAVGRVEQGPAPLVGRRVFVLHPHQDSFVVPSAAVTPVPDDVPSERALLAGAVETTLNALWDGGPLLGDRVAVMGAGLIGACAALLLDRLPLDRLVVVEPRADRRAPLAAAGLDVREQAPDEHDFDLVFDAAAHADALNAALELLGVEGTLVELSWFGDAPAALTLGAAFHARRLRIVASQVGLVSPARRARRSTADRLRLALGYLADDRFDALLGPATPFAELPATMAALAAGDDLGPCPVIRYE